MKKLLLGNEAVARGLYEAGVRFVSSYPGTPSTEITESAVKFPEIYCEWAPNEKVAAEAAAGAAIAGARSFCAMKHVGLNVAADPLFTMSYIGVNGGMLIAVADDPGMFSSQNEQDSRHYARASKVPMLEPSDSGECRDFVKEAYKISEKYDTPVILRLSTRVSHGRSIVECHEREELPLREYKKAPQKNVMLPAFARPKHVAVEKRTVALRQLSEETPLNRAEYSASDVGVITSGGAYQYVKEALGESVSVLKLGMCWPLPDELIKSFCSKCKKVYVIEELDSFIEDYCRELGLEVTGKEIFPRCGELSQSIIRKALLNEEYPFESIEDEIPARPPAMCCGCPHRGVFYALKKQKVFVSGDIGCYTLGASAPLGAMDSCICMGASISSLHGRNKVLGGQSEKKSVAVIGDSTFIHSGITSLINVSYNASNSLVIILDNSITGMTGHQQNPSTGYNIKGDPAAKVDLEALCHAIGINRVRVVDPYDLPAVSAAIKEELSADEPSVIISRRPCVLLKHVKRMPALHVDKCGCIGCGACIGLGCPALSIKDAKAFIDPSQCVGCGVCSELCRFNAIKGKGGEQNG